jgi:hypothetical protein
VNCAEELECDKELAFAKEKAVTSINVQNRIESRRYQTWKHEEAWNYEIREMSQPVAKVTRY